VWLTRAMLFQRKGSEIAPRPSTASGRSEPAELRRARSKEVLSKKYSELCELYITIVESFLRLRKFLIP
jgi:hypothetical protein